MDRSGILGFVDHDDLPAQHPDRGGAAVGTSTASTGITSSFVVELERLTGFEPATSTLATSCSAC